MTADLEQLLRDADLRVTRPRLAVLAAVHEHPHADTDGSSAPYAARSARFRTRPSTTCCAR